MSLIQDALEKAGRLPAAVVKPAPPREENPPREPEVKVEKMTAPKAEALWFVALKVKMLGMMDKMRIKSWQKNESRKTGFIAAGLILLFLGAFVYVHHTAPRSSSGNPAQIFPADPAADPVPQKDFPAAVSAPDFQLTGITLSGTTRLALINDQVVGAGEKLKEGAEVVEIQEQKATLTFQGKKIELEL